MEHSKILAKTTLLARACRPITDSTRILDLTAGFGIDSMGFALRGAKVTAIEVQPEIFQQLQINTANIDNLQLLLGDASKELPKLGIIYDCCYLDPMFTSKSSSALPKQYMQKIASLAQATTISQQSQLLELALNYCKKAVVKRHIKGPILLPKFLNSQIKGKTIRFDIYCGVC